MLTHHAYYSEGSVAQFGAYVKQLRASEGFLLGDPSFSAQLFDTFGIDDARTLIQAASLKNTGRTLFFVGAAAMTTEAQQALLKLLEEPQQGTIFVLLVPHGTLIPTLRSRCLPYFAEFTKGESTNDAQIFLSWPYKKRSEWIAEMLKDSQDPREQTRIFLTELESILYKRIGEGREVRESLSEIGHFRGYLSDKAPSLKMLLEHFAATLPQSK